jgi:hypothetical protein
MVLEMILEKDFIGPEIHQSRANQYRIIVTFNGYPYVVPLIIDNDSNWFLKTIYPSRKEKERSKQHEKKT